MRQTFDMNMLILDIQLLALETNKKLIKNHHCFFCSLCRAQTVLLIARSETGVTRVSP